MKRIPVPKNKSKRRRTWRKVCLIALPIVVIAAVALYPLQHWHAPNLQTSKLQPPDQYNLNKLVGHIQTNNDNINQINGNIVTDMGQISQLADTTGRIDSGLHTLQHGANTENNSLDHLNDLSGQELQLSTDLHSLASQLQGNLSSIKQSSASEQSSVQQMLSTAKSLSQTATNVAGQNDTIAGKLNDAAAKTDTVEHNMP